jgi:murein DD-endopeptidase MepM/ murein hydrolase activator NlpD
VFEGRVEPRSTLETLLRDSLSRQSIQRLVTAARPVYDLARLSVGRPFAITMGPDGIMSSFRYGIDDLRTLTVRRSGDDLRADLETRTYESRVERASGTITSSLFGAVTEAGEQDQLAMDLAAVFEWDIDFNTELQKGDSFRVAVQKLYLEGRLAGYGAIQAAEFVRGDHVYKAVRYDGPNGPEYFTPEGVPVRKPFLRSPLKFSRISSGFTHARFHPILKTVRPHLGVDFAAPVGTPVRSAADGVVVSAGWEGGYGKVVKLRHSRGLDTLYGHLSRIDVRPGQRVSQGSLIGAVGSTGLSTGPHLDYRILLKGVYVNPLKLTPPPPEPLPKALMADFGVARDRALTALDAPAAPPVQLARSE